MKKTLYIFILSLLITTTLVLGATICHAQGIAQKWQTTGNYGVGQSGYIGTNDANPIVFKTKFLKRAFFDSIGRFIIGNNSGNGYPSAYKFIVVDSSNYIGADLSGFGGVNATNYTNLSNKNGTGVGFSGWIPQCNGAIGGIVIRGYNGGNSLFQIYNTYKSSRQSRVLIDSLGLFGIGTINPTQKLQVHGMIYSDSLGYKFPDGSIQTSAYVPANFWSTNGQLLTGSERLGSTNNVDYSLITNNLTAVNIGYGGSSGTQTFIGDNLRVASYSTGNYGDGLFSVNNVGYLILGDDAGDVNNTVVSIDDRNQNIVENANLEIQNSSSNISLISDSVTLNSRQTGNYCGGIYNTDAGNICLGWNVSRTTPDQNNILIGNQIGVNGFGDISSQNVIIGSRSQYTTTALTNATIIGYQATTDNSTGSYDDVTAIGSRTVITDDHSIFLGDALVHSVYSYGNYQTISDKRLKNVTADTVAGLAFIEKLKPVQYYMKNDSATTLLRTGLLAQDVDSAAISLGFNFDGVKRPRITNDVTKGQYSIDYAKLVLPLIVAVKQQQSEIESLKKQLEILNKK